jgi:hypothetical protein
MEQNAFQAYTIAAGQDLSAAQYKAVTVGGTIASTADAAIGLVQNKPENGQHCTVSVSGVMKGYAGAAIVTARPVTVTTSGFLINVTSGDGVVTGVGKALAAANSGDLFKFVGNFAAAKNTVV